MATQLKPSDFTYAAQAPRPNISVVFNAGPAALAVREKADQLPADIRDATLDEITQPVDLPIRLLVVERNAIIERINTDATLSEEIVATLCKRLNEIDATIGDRAADTPDDAVMKLLTLAHITAEGHEINEAEAERAIVEAHKHFGVGALHGRAIEAARGPAVLPDGYDPYLRGYYVAWQRAYDTYADHRAKRIAFETGPQAEAMRKLDAITASYPINYNLRADPVAAAAIDATGYYELEEQFDQMGSLEHKALERLISSPAPSASELAIKLKLFEATEGWEDTNARELTAVMVADARRFGRHGAYLQSDATLLGAFAASKKERRSWLPHVGEPLNNDEYEASVERSVAAEQVVWGERASTLEGVLAKLVCLFPEIVQETWSDHAITDPSYRTFQPGLDAACGNHRVLWATINDLARIAGVNLAELGA